MRHRFAFYLALLLPALMACGCSGLKSGGESFNQPPVYEGPGCYDHKGRIERTIIIKAECDRQGWVWKTAP
jgi:hypothetical protein